MNPGDADRDTSVDLSVPRRCHVVGIGGPGMSALAILLHGAGHAVSGSDIRQSTVTDSLRASGIAVTIGHDAANIEGADYVTYSTAVPAGNIELAASRAAGIPTVHRSVMLGELTAGHESVGVAGTHGKTTTSSLLTVILRAAGHDPSFYIGADVLSLGTGAGTGTGRTLVVEADESDGTARALHLTSMILTNVDKDHLDRFGTVEALESEFAAVAAGLTGALVVCGDDPRAVSVARSARCPVVITYGFGEGNDVIVSDPVPSPGGIEFSLVRNGRTVAVSLPLRGRHNALNCAAAIVMAAESGVDPGVAAAAVAGFAGVDRRFIERGTFNGALLIDDYAHLPAEIEAVLAAAREHPARTGRVVAVFQPNRYHRIAEMAGDYAGSFSAADDVFITDIYASGTERIEGVTGMMVVDAVRSRHRSVTWAQTRPDLVAAVAAGLQPGDICISMGCGDIADFPQELADRA